MNSLFGPACFMAYWLRFMAAMSTYFLLLTWDYGVTLLPWPALFMVSFVWLFQSIENVCLEQTKQWNEYLGKREHELQR